MKHNKLNYIGWVYLAGEFTHICQNLQRRIKGPGKGKDTLLSEGVVTSLMLFL